MKRSTLNDTKLGDTNPRGRWGSPLLGHYARSMPSGREEKNQPLNFCRLRRQTAPWYTLDEDQRTEREVRNCPPKRVRSIPAFISFCGRSFPARDDIGVSRSLEIKHPSPRGLGTAKMPGKVYFWSQYGFRLT